MTEIFPPPNPADDDYIRRGDLMKAQYLFYAPTDRSAKTGLFDPQDWALRVSSVYDVHPADVRPVVRGRWEVDGHHVRCSICGEYMCNTDREGDKIPLAFCPNCGTDMRDGNDGI